MSVIGVSQNAIRVIYNRFVNSFDTLVNVAGMKTNIKIKYFNV